VQFLRLQQDFFLFQLRSFLCSGALGGFFLYTHISMLLHGVRLDAQFFYYLHFQFSLWESLTTIMDAYVYYSCQFLSAQLVNIDRPGQLLPGLHQLCLVMMVSNVSNQSQPEPGLGRLGKLKL
jgi:hypothetical protein